jgi:hypothetical protein
LSLYSKVVPDGKYIASHFFAVNHVGYEDLDRVDAMHIDSAFHLDDGIVNP